MTDDMDERFKLLQEVFRCYPTCPTCGIAHDPALPHDKNSNQYKEVFLQTEGRLPTWDDAMAHCTAETKIGWNDAIGRAANTRRQLH